MSYQQQPQPSYPQQPGYAPPPAPAPKKKRHWLWALLGVVALLLVLGVAANMGKDTGTEPTGAPAGNEQGAKPNAPAATERVVVYRVTGTGPASLTYTTDGATTINQETDVALPWEKTIKLPAGEALLMVSLLAQGTTQASEVNVEIIVDGKLYKEAHATGVGIASANGNIGEMG